MSEKVALIYATYNRAPLLRRSLERLSELTVPDEIIVVDDGSSDETEQVCVDANDRLGLPLRRVYNHRPYHALCSQAKNVGIKSTDADVLIFSEPEMFFETDVVAQLLKRHSDDQVQCHPPIKQSINVGRVLHEQSPGGSTYETVNWQALWVALFRREWLLSVGGWDEDFPGEWGHDDVDLGTRLRISGVGQYNDLDAIATHQYHRPIVCDQSANEAYVRSKSFLHDERPDHPELIANRGHGWGVPICRT